MSPLCHGVLPNELSYYTIEMVKGLCPNVVEIAEPAKEGYQLALKLNLNQIPRNKDYDKVIMEISTIHSVILSSQLKEILWNVNSDDALQGMYKPIKLLYHPKDLFVLIRQPQRIIAVFPIRFKEKSDVIIATNFFQSTKGFILRRMRKRLESFVEVSCTKQTQKKMNKPNNIKHVGTRRN
ncbi:Actin-related protein 2/3 complex subunit 2B [Glycine soja]